MARKALSGNTVEKASNILIFGGTSEGRELTQLLADAGASVCVSVATERGLKDFFVDSPLVSFHQGALTQEEKVQFMSDFDAIVDATHPYAQSISGHVREAATLAGKPYLRVLRPLGDVQGCLVAPTLAEAVALIPAEGAVLSTTGAKELAVYQALPCYRERLVARVLDDDASLEKARSMGLPDEHILAGRGPFSQQENEDVIERFDIKTLVTKESGTAGGYPEKRAAARAHGVTVVVVARPVEEDGMSVEEAFAVLSSSDTPASPNAASAGAVPRDSAELPHAFATSDSRVFANTEI